MPPKSQAIVPTPETPQTVAAETQPLPPSDGRTAYAVKPGTTEIAGQKLRGRTEVRLLPGEEDYLLRVEAIALPGTWPSSWGVRSDANEAGANGAEAVSAGNASAL